MNMQFAFQEVAKMEFGGDVTTLAGATAVSKYIAKEGSRMSEEVAKSVGREFLKKYAGGAGKELGGVAIEKGSEAALGRLMLSPDVIGGATATMASRSGDVVLNVGARNLFVQGMKGGASFGAGMAAAAAELLASQFDATKEHKKKIGFATQVGTGAAVGSGAGPLGAAAGAGVGALSWATSQIIGMVIEKQVLNSRGSDSPAIVKYLEAKSKYESALEALTPRSRL
jgi:hypothetical protein